MQKASTVLGSPITLTVVGPAADAGLWAESTNLVVGASDEAVTELVRSAWVMVAPSLYEGFGIPTVEALTLGVPVVTTSNPGNDYLTELAPAHLPSQIVSDDELVNAVVSRIDEGPALEDSENDAIDTFADTLRSITDPGRLLAVYEQLASSDRRP